MSASTWVLIPCQRSRLSLLREAILSYAHPADRVVVVATQPDPLTPRDLEGIADHVVLHDDTAHLIGAWWNRGLDYITERTESAGSAGSEPFEVFAPSSDVIGTPESIPVLRGFLRSNGLVMVGPDYHGGAARPAHPSHQIFRLEDTRTVHRRVPGACWMLAGESKLRLDPQFRWWYSDDDLEMQARQAGGVGIMQDTGLMPGPDTALSGEKLLWAHEDRQKFVTKWGHEPW